MTAETNPIGALIDTEQLEWRRLDQGTSVKLLRVNEETAAWSMLVRADAGAVNSRHMHMGPADFLVLSGCIEYRGGRAEAGAWVYEPAGAVHDRTTHPVDTVYLANVHGSLTFLDDDDRVVGVMDGFILRERLASAGPA